MTCARPRSIVVASRRISWKNFCASLLPIMTTPDLIVRGLRVLWSEAKEPAPAAIHIHHGIIMAISKFADVPPGSPVFDAGDSVVMPGLVDTHVHINEPGRTDWEGFSTATQAAAAGGITTVVDMPLNSIPATTTFEALKVKEAEARGKCHVDYGLWGGVVPGNASELEPMARSGAL